MLDDSLKIKLDGSFNNTTTYSIRSPMYHQKSEDSNHEEEGEEAGSEDEYSETEVSDESESEDETATATATTSRKGAAK